MFVIRTFRSAAKLRACFSGCAEADQRTDVTFLGKEVGKACLCKLLAVGQKRLRRAQSMTPDCRFGKNKQESRSGTYSVDAFLSMMYDGVAETLPDRQAD